MSTFRVLMFALAISAVCALIVVVAVKLLGILVNGIVLAAVVGLISGACAVLLLRRRAGSSK